MANAAGVEPDQQPVRGASITLKTVAGDSTVIPLPAPANLDALREAILKALNIPKNRQSLLVNSAPLVDNQHLERALALGDGNLTIVVLAKNPSYTKCAQHEAYDEDYFCKTCKKFFCPRCAVAHGRIQGHIPVDTTDEVEFFKYFQSDIDKGKVEVRRRLVDLQGKEKQVLQARQQALEKFFDSHSQYLEVLTTLTRAKLKEDQLNKAKTPEEIAVLLSMEATVAAGNAAADSSDDDEDVFGPLFK
jgi:hypothetical protein